METGSVVNLLIQHKRNLENNILPEYEKNEGTARINFQIVKDDLSRLFEKAFVDLRFNKLLYNDDRTDIENAISYISNVITALESGDDIKIAQQN